MGQMETIKLMRYKLEITMDKSEGNKVMERCKEEERAIFNTAIGYHEK